MVAAHAMITMPRNRNRLRECIDRILMGEDEPARSPYIHHIAAFLHLSQPSSRCRWHCSGSLLHPRSQMRPHRHGCLPSTTDICRAEKVMKITGPPSVVSRRSKRCRLTRGGITLDVHRPAMCPCRREPTLASTRGLIVIDLTVPCWCVAAWLTFVASAPVFAQCSQIASDEQTFDFLVRCTT